MSDLSFWRMRMVAGMLEPAEREAVLGDLLEANDGGWRAVFSVLGLVIRRQAEL